MSDDINVAPGDGGGDSASVTVVTPAADLGNDISVSQAARALAAARHKPREKPAEAAPVEAAPATTELAVEANAAPLEVEALSEDTKEAEPDANPPIEPPRSWTKDAKEKWQSLPRDTQEYLSAREQERDREVRRSQNDAAEKLKGLTAKEQEVEKARQEYEAKLPAIMQMLQNRGEFADVRTMDDVKKLQAEDPFRFQAWQLHQMELQAVDHELRTSQERQSKEHQSKWAEHVNKENALVAEKLPEFADKDKARDLQNKAVERLNDLGFTQSELADLASGKEKLSIYDHRIQLLIADSLKLADFSKAKTAAIAKPVPQVQRPGTARPQGAAASENLQALTNRLNDSGDLKDAVAVLAARRASARRP